MSFNFAVEGSSSDHDESSPLVKNDPSDLFRTNESWHHLSVADCAKSAD